jgi:hypothetical protein
LGSLLCETLSRRKIELGLVLWGALGLGVFGIDLYFASRGIINQPGVLNAYPLNYLQCLQDPASARVLLDIALLGVFGGFYIVPLYAYVQSTVAQSHQARVMASNNILNALFMVASGVLSIALLKLGLSIESLFLVTAIMNSALLIALCLYQPAFFHAGRRWIASLFSGK